MKALVAYRINHHLVEWLQKTLAIQERVLSRTWDHIAVCDEQVPDMPTYESDLVQTEEGFSLAKASNIALDLAKTGGYDLLVLLDADIVLLDAPIEVPEKGAGVIFCHFQKSPQEIIPPPIGHYKPTAQWILNRDVINQCRFCEHYVGHGFEDLDFHYCSMWPLGFSQEDSSVRGVHRHHGLRSDTFPTGRQNKERFKARLRVVSEQQGHAPDKWADEQGRIDESKLAQIP